MQPVIKIKNLCHIWPNQTQPVININQLEIQKGDTFFIQGASGSGKSTFLNILAGIISNQTSEVQLLNSNISQLSNKQRDQFRANHIGYIFQQFNLINYLTVLENVMLACQASNIRAARAIKKHGSIQSAAHFYLSQLNIDESLLHKQAMRLSVGQQQRVAAARALIGQPEIIIADEPTSSLDQQNVSTFIEVLISQCKKIQATLIFVSHDLTLKPHFNSHYILNANNLKEQDHAVHAND
ncbi:ABC transporter ATP-binding protein [Marinicellulosiphila megalodicopiae]|uniref:ABC transporter ATP-binding protein n=1 Tax=Marinicellulosiphila megalodicopiae TaxID=2724896 RepID=UPI003BAF6604